MISNIKANCDGRLYSINMETDALIANQLSLLLLNASVNCDLIDPVNQKLLEFPFLNIKPVDEQREIKIHENQDDFNLQELKSMLQDFIHERKVLVEAFNIVNAERIHLRRQNCELISRIFEMDSAISPSVNINNKMDFEAFLNKALFMQYELKSLVIEKMHESHLKNLALKDERIEELSKLLKDSHAQISHMQTENADLNAKLKKERNTLKYYLTKGVAQMDPQLHSPDAHTVHDDKSSSQSQNQSLQTKILQQQQMSPHQQIPTNVAPDISQSFATMHQIPPNATFLTRAGAGGHLTQNQEMLNQMKNTTIANISAANSSTQQSKHLKKSMSTKNLDQSIIAKSFYPTGSNAQQSINQGQVLGGTINSTSTNNNNMVTTTLAQHRSQMQKGKMQSQFQQQQEDGHLTTLKDRRNQKKTVNTSTQNQQNIQQLHNKL